MNIPRFTAEATLYSSKNSYRLSCLIRHQFASNILPQLMIRYCNGSGACYAGGDVNGGYWFSIIGPAYGLVGDAGGYGVGSDVGIEVYVGGASEGSGGDKSGRDIVAEKCRMDCYSSHGSGKGLQKCLEDC